MTRVHVSWPELIGMAIGFVMMTCCFYFLLGLADDVSDALNASGRVDVIVRSIVVTGVLFIVGMALSIIHGTPKKEKK